MIKLEINNQTKQRVYYSRLKKAASIAGRELKIKKTYLSSLGLVNEGEIKRLNRKYRKKDKITDVLSFTGEDNYLGEIIICIPAAKKQAKKFRHSLHCELQFLFIHGLLHLLGFEHKTKKDRQKMEKLQDKIMAGLC